MNPYDLRPQSTRTYDPNSYASELYDRLQENIQTAKSNLQADEELAAYYYMASGGMIGITSFGYHNPYLIIIYGVDEQMNECQVLTHAYSFQIVMKVLKVENQNQRKTIGFIGDINKTSESGQEQEKEVTPD
jgi:hypothetical protein